MPVLDRGRRRWNGRQSDWVADPRGRFNSDPEQLIVELFCPSKASRGRVPMARPARKILRSRAAPFNVCGFERFRYRLSRGCGAGQEPWDVTKPLRV